MKRHVQVIGLRGDHVALRRCAALIAVAALIAGCSLEPCTSGRTRRSPWAIRVVTRTSRRSADRPHRTAGGRHRLARLPDDPRLQRLVQIALTNNRDLRVAALTVAQTQAQYRIERATLFPTLSGFVDSSTVRTPASTSTSAVRC